MLMAEKLYIEYKYMQLWMALVPLVPNVKMLFDLVIKEYEIFHGCLHFYKYICITECM